MDIQNPPGDKVNTLDMIRKNTVQRRTMMFESGGDDPPPLKVDTTPAGKPQINRPKPSPRSVNTQASVVDVETPPRQSVLQRTAMFETPSQPTSPGLQSQPHRKAPAPPGKDQSKSGVQSPVATAPLTPEQVVRPKTCVSSADKPPVYAQVDKKNKSAKPPKPNNPKLERIKGRPPTEKYDGVVIIPGEPVRPLMEHPGKPPPKPPRTFAHDQYLKAKELKKKHKRKNSGSSEEPESAGRHGDSPYKEPVVFRDGVATATAETSEYEEIAGGSVPAPAAPTKPCILRERPSVQPPKPPRPERPPSLTEKTPAATTPHNHIYEEIDRVKTQIASFLDNGGDERSHRTNGTVSGKHDYAEIDTKHVTTRKKTVESPKVVGNAAQTMDGSQKPGKSPPESSRRPESVYGKTPKPVPPRPRPPTTPATAGEHDEPESSSSRWEKPFVRVVKHNANLTVDSFVSKRNFRNPGYERQHSVIEGATSLRQRPAPVEKGLTKSNSDQYLYAEVKSPVIKDDNDDDSAIYHDPVELLTPSPHRRGDDAANVSMTTPDHGVELDDQGYAIPDISGAGSVGRRSGGVYRKNIQRCGTISVGRAKYLRSPTGGGTAAAAAHKRSPQVRERLSRAYSVLRRRPSADGAAGDATATALSCVPEDDDDSDQEVDAEDHRRRLQYVSSIRDFRPAESRISQYAAIRPRRRSREMYSYALVVGLEPRPGTQQYRPAVLYTHPAEEVPTNIGVILDFCFPDADNWRPVTHYQSESFSFVLTNSEGHRQYGYCKRILPPGSCNRLPEVYCVVSDLGSAATFYASLLERVESRRALSAAHAHDVLRAALRTPLPEPGREAYIRCLGASNNKDTLILKRLADYRAQKVGFSVLLSHLSVETLLRVFAAVLLERRVIFIGQHLGTLTSCIHALVALLYPLSWQHTFIPILPHGLLEVVCAPTPYIVGVLTAAQPSLADMPMEQVLQVDLESGRLLESVGDESRIIPRKLQRALSAALRDDSGVSAGVSAGGTDGVAGDVMICEAFLRLFVETIGHYGDYILTQQDGKDIFLREQFTKAVSSRSIRLFLEWFTDTQMFSVFIHNVLENNGADNAELFEARIEEYRAEMTEMAPTLRDNVRQVGRRMLNFFIESGTKVKKALGSNVFI